MGASSQSRGIITRIAKCDNEGGRESNNTCKQVSFVWKCEVENVVGPDKRLAKNPGYRR